MDECQRFCRPMNVEELHRRIGKLASISDLKQRSCLLSELDCVPIDEVAVRKYDHHFLRASGGRRRVSTCCPGRLPGKDEVVVCYGSYPPSSQALVFHRHIHRPVEDFFVDDLPFDVFESDDSWQKLDAIVYINLEPRIDRRHSILRELARVEAPLDRVERLAACQTRETGLATVDGQISCLLSHLSACRRLMAKGIQNALILEDDFGFIHDVRAVHDGIRLFLDRSYNYDLCLLATSKYGSVDPYDDLVCCTRQPCTNSAAYFVSWQGLPPLISCFEEALDGLRRTSNTLKYAIDRYWKKLQGERFLLLNKKLGYQIASYSDIEARLVSYND